VRAANEFQNVRCRFKQTADQWRDKAGERVRLARWRLRPRDREPLNVRFNDSIRRWTKSPWRTLQRFEYKRRIKREPKLAAAALDQTLRMFPIQRFNDSIRRWTNPPWRTLQRIPGTPTRHAEALCEGWSFLTRRSMSEGGGEDRNDFLIHPS
jgi:hypothetical protein